MSVCLCVCMFVPKDLPNRLTDQVLLYRVASEKVYINLGGGNHHPPKRNCPQKKSSLPQQKNIWYIIQRMLPSQSIVLLFKLKFKNGDGLPPLPKLKTDPHNFFYIFLKCKIKKMDIQKSPKLLNQRMRQPNIPSLLVWYPLSTFPGCRVASLRARPVPENPCIKGQSHANPFPMISSC